MTALFLQDLGKWRFCGILARLFWAAQQKQQREGNFRKLTAEDDPKRFPKTGSKFFFDLCGKNVGLLKATLNLCLWDRYISKDRFGENKNAHGCKKFVFVCGHKKTFQNRKEKLFHDIFSLKIILRCPAVKWRFLMWNNDRNPNYPLSTQNQ